MSGATGDVEYEGEKLEAHASALVDACINANSKRLVKGVLELLCMIPHTLNFAVSSLVQQFSESSAFPSMWKPFAHLFRKLEIGEQHLELILDTFYPVDTEPAPEDSWGIISESYSDGYYLGSYSDVADSLLERIPLPAIIADHSRWEQLEVYVGKLQSHSPRRWSRLRRFITSDGLSR